MSSNYQSVLEFNKSFGLPVFTEPKKNIFTEEPKLVKLRLDLIKEEVRELVEDGFWDKNFVEVVDALTDILYVVYGAGSSLGIDLDKEFNVKILELYSTFTPNASHFYNIQRCNQDLDQGEIQQDIFKDSTQAKIIFNKFIVPIQQETINLEKQIYNGDYKGLSESLNNLLHVTYFCGAVLNINLDKSFEIVHKSNMSKLCLTEDLAKKTVEWYKKNESRYDSPTYRESYDKKYYVVFNKSTGKILKSIDYTPACFKVMLN
jgi:predicted HAD superfamily Cof-like phosphohydrolase